jgi:hypothetical protein
MTNRHGQYALSGLAVAEPGKNLRRGDAAISNRHTGLNPGGESFWSPKQEYPATAVVHCTIPYRSENIQRPTVVVILSSNGAEHKKSGGQFCGYELLNHILQLMLCGAVTVLALDIQENGVARTKKDHEVYLGAEVGAAMPRSPQRNKTAFGKLPRRRKKGRLRGL